MANQQNVSRREVLALCGRGLALAPFASLMAWGRTAPQAAQNPGGPPFQGTDEQLLDEIQKGSFQFFWNETNPQTGQVKDRAFLNGKDTRKMSSIAATGFGLTSLCIGDARGYAAHGDILERVRVTLRFLANQMPTVHGFYYHFVDMDNGQRWAKCELSSIDTSLLLCAILTARTYFKDAEIQDLATKIHNRVEWPWMLNAGPTFSMGWMPESGFLKAR